MTTAWPVDTAAGARSHSRGWPWVPLESVAELTTGHTPDRQRPDYWNGGISWVNLNEIRDLDGQVCHKTELQVSAEGIAHSSAVVHPAGTVCLSRTASVGFVTLMGSPMATSQDFVNWTCGPRLDPAYLMRALRASRPRILSLCSGSTHKTMYVRQAERLQILLPPLEEQRRIAAILDKADELQAKRRAAIAHLDSLTQAIFLDMFGDPVANTKGWPLGRLGDLTEFETGKSLDTSDGEPSLARYRVLKVSALSSGEFRPAESKPVRPDYCPPRSHLVRKGDLLFSRANTEALVGATAMVVDEPEGLLLSDKTWRFVWREPSTVTPAFIHAMLQAPRTRLAISRFATGTSGSMKNVSQRKLLTLSVALPPIDLQMDFAAKAEGVAVASARVRASAAEANRLTASLQARAFRGEL